MNYNELFRELAEYNRLKEEAESMIDGVKDKIRETLRNDGLTAYIGAEHAVKLQTVTGSRIDTKALRERFPEAAEAVTVATETERFLFK